MTKTRHPADSKPRFDSILNHIRKWRTRSLKIIFPILIVENIITGEKPNELNPWEEISAIAIVGIALIYLGAMMRLWARGHFERGRLFTTGPYAIVRHPLYLGSLLIVIGLLLILDDPLSWAIILPLWVTFHTAAIIYEERSLQSHFGRQWTVYKANVPAILPSLRSLLSARQPSRWSRRLFLNTGELVTFLLALSLPVLLELLEEVIFEDMLGF